MKWSNQCVALLRIIDWLMLKLFDPYNSEKLHIACVRQKTWAHRVDAGVPDLWVAREGKCSSVFIDKEWKSDQG